MKLVTTKSIKNHMVRVEKGSTLIIAILIMATIGASLYIVGNIAIRTLRQVFATVAGETVILGADAALEQGLWAHTRKKTSYEGNCDQNPPVYRSSTLSGDLSDVTIIHCKSQFPNPTSVVLDSVTLSKEIYVLDPDNPESGGGYNSVTFRWRSGSGEVKICQWQTIDCATELFPYRIFDQSRNLNRTEDVNLNSSEKYIIYLQIDPTDYSTNITAAPRGLPAETVIVKGRGVDPFVTRSLDVGVSP